MLYNIVIFIVRILVKLIFNVQVEGKENFPTGGGYVLSSNHRSNLDPIVLALKNPQRLKFMAKEELFKFKPFGWFITNLGAYPISRGKGDTKALEATVDYLKNGSPVLIFPEGTRSKDGIPKRGKSGAALLAGQAGVGVLAISIDYGKKLRFRTKIVLRVHPLITPEQLGVNPEQLNTVRGATRLIMDTITSGLTHLPKEEK